MDVKEIANQKITILCAFSRIGWKTWNGILIWLCWLGHRLTAGDTTWKWWMAPSVMEPSRWSLCYFRCHSTESTAQTFLLTNVAEQRKTWNSNRMQTFEIEFYRDPNRNPNKMMDLIKFPFTDSLGIVESKDNRPRSVVFQLNFEFQERKCRKEWKREYIRKKET